jgi:hypothetical protein
LKALQNAINLGEIADEMADRQREHPDKRWRSHDLISIRQFRLLIDVNNLQICFAAQLMLADVLKSFDRSS